MLRSAPVPLFEGLWSRNRLRKPDRQSAFPARVAKLWGGAPWAPVGSCRMGLLIDLSRVGDVWQLPKRSTETVSALSRDFPWPQSSRISFLLLPGTRFLGVPLHREPKSLAPELFHRGPAAVETTEIAFGA